MLYSVYNQRQPQILWLTAASYSRPMCGGDASLRQIALT